MTLIHSSNLQNAANFVLRPLYWGDSLNQHRRGGKRNTMVMIFVGGVVLMFEGFLVLFLLLIIYAAGVFCSRPNPYRG
jgi:hypothetical protein